MATKTEERELRLLKHEVKELEKEVQKAEATKNRRRQEKRKRRKKRRSTGEEIFQLSAIILGLVLFVTFCIHDGAYDDFVQDGVVTSQHGRTQGTFVADYLSYTKHSLSNEPDSSRINIDTSTFYVRASELGITYNASATVSTGDSNLKISVNSPTQPLEVAGKDYIPFVSNVYGMTQLRVSDMASAEEKLAPASNRGEPLDVTALTETLCKSSNAFHVYRNTNYYSVYCGALGGAITCPNYYEDKMWLGTSPPMWDRNRPGIDTVPADTAVNKYAKPFPVNLMLVKTPDLQKYLAGEAVDVYYVEYWVVDAKGHASPWGVAQTNVTSTASNFGILCGGYGTSGCSHEWDCDFTVTEEMKESTTAYWEGVYAAALTAPAKHGDYVAYQFPAFWKVPCSSRYTTLEGTSAASTVEQMTNGASVAFGRWRRSFPDGLTLVGCLCFTGGELIPDATP